MILLNTILVFLLLVLFFVRHESLPAAYLWGMRLGLVVVLFGSGWGQMMVSNSAHAVGAPDGGLGLPILNWSTTAGDLRIAHLLGLHGLQIIPLAGYFLARRAAYPVLMLAGFTAIYAAAMFHTLFWALQGVPLLKL